MSDEPQSPSEIVVTIVGVADAARTYSADEAARQCGLHPDLLRHYCQLGLLGAAYRDRAPDARFDDTALYWLRRVESVRRRHGLDRATLPLVCELWHEIERLEAEVRFLRAR
jgi:DNA-binding transcriptional MerR regulator